MEIAQDVARKLIEAHIEHGDPLPPKIKAALQRQWHKTTAKIPIGISTKGLAA